MDKVSSVQAHELNGAAHSYGMMSNDFFSFLTRDVEEAENMKIAREREEEKAMFSVTLTANWILSLQTVLELERKFKLVLKNFKVQSRLTDFFLLYSSILSKICLEYVLFLFIWCF